jgi:hypothetical protein
VITAAGRPDPEGTADVLAVLLAVWDIKGLSDVAGVSEGVGVLVCAVVWVERTGGVSCVADGTAVDSGLAKSCVTKKSPKRYETDAYQSETPRLEG